MQKPNQEKLIKQFLGGIINEKTFLLIMVFVIILSVSACKNDFNNNTEETTIIAGVIDKNSTADFSADKNETTSSNTKMTLDNSNIKHSVSSEKTAVNSTKSAENNNISKDPRRCAISQ